MAFAGLLLAQWLLLAQPASDAELTVTVSPFKGPSAARARAQVSEAVSRLARRLHRRREWPRCASGECGLVVRGEVLAAGRIRLTLLDGNDEVLDQFAVNRGGAPLEKGLASHLRTAMTRAAAGRPAAPPEPAPPPSAVAEAPPAPEQEKPVPSAPVPMPVPAPAPAPAPAPVHVPVHVSPSHGGDTELAVTPPSPRSAEERPSVLEVAVGGGSMSRWLKYKDDLFNALSTYQLPGGPLVAGEVEAYPLARVTDGWLGGVGLYGQLQHSFAMSSSTGIGAAIPTTSASYAGGLKLRHAFGALQLGIGAGYGVESFDIGATSGIVATLPNYDYSFVEGAADGRIGLAGGFAVLLRAGYQQVLSNSLAAQGYFPRATAAGVDAAGGPALALTDLFELRLVADYRRFFFSMHPKPGDPHVAGGALDQYLCATLELAVRLR